eukprot:8704856-Pyramimonas_sp.AAC.1
MATPATQVPLSNVPPNPTVGATCVSNAVAAHPAAPPQLSQAPSGTAVSGIIPVTQSASNNQPTQPASATEGGRGRGCGRGRGRGPSSGRGRGRATPATNGLPTGAPGVVNTPTATQKLTAAQKQELSEAQWTQIPYDPSEGARTGANISAFSPDLPRTRSDAHCSIGGPSKKVYEHVLEKSSPLEFLDLFLTSEIKGTMRKNSNLYATGVREATATGFLDWYPFSDEDIDAFIAVLFMNGLHPVHEMEQWFIDPDTSPIYGDSRVRRLFPKNPRRRWKHLRSLFHVSYPFDDKAKRGKLGKIQELEDYLKKRCEELWRTGFKGSLDEQTIGFSGRCALKIRIKCKAEGDGFQCDAYCEEGYTFTWLWRMEEYPPFYEGCSPLHTRCLMILSKVHHPNSVCFVDNLYTSKAFFMAALTKLPNPVLMAGVCRTGNRGFPKKIEQASVTAVRDLEMAKGTVKVAVHENKKMVALSIYDEKPVHVLTTTFADVVMVNKARPVFNREAGEVQPLPFQKLNVIDAYNYGMNNVDRADQLRGNYRPDRFTRQRKWWWAPFIWLLGIAMTNAYVVYKLVLQHAGKMPLTHRGFIEMVVAEMCARVIERRKYKVRGILPPGTHGSKPSKKRARVSDSSSTGSISDTSRSQKLTEAFLLHCGRLDRSRNHQLQPLAADNGLKRCQYCNYLARSKVQVRAK